MKTGHIHHHHHHGHHGHTHMGIVGRSSEIYRVTIVGGVVNLLLVVFKFVAGIVGRSAAMTADAVHSLSDFVTDIVVILFVRVSGRPVDRKHNYGHGKFETLATLIISVLLVSVGLGIAYNGIVDIIAVVGGAVLPSPGMLALWAALLSIAAKEAVFRYTVAAGRRLRSDAVVANAWHHRSDALSSIGTALGIGGAVLLGDRWTVLDPIAAVVVSFFILRIGVQLLKPSVDELMERSLPDEVEDEIRRTVSGVPGVSDLHDLRTRKIGNNYAIDFHIRMDGAMSLTESHAVGAEAERRLKGLYGDQTYVSVHVEPIGEECCASLGNISENPHEQ